MGANYLDSIKENKKGGNSLPPFSTSIKFTQRQRLGSHCWYKSKAALIHH